MTGAAIAAPVDRAGLQRRTMRVLRLAQVPGQAAVAGMIAVVTLLAGDLLGSDRLAGLGSAGFTLGAALTAVPMSAVMRRHGRRPGLSGALAIGAVGAALAATGGQLRWFPVFIVGMVLFGAGQAAALQGRYAAADLAEPAERASAIGAIVWIGTLGAVFGPLLTPLEKSAARALGLDELVGPFLFACLFFVVAASVLWTRLRPDPLVAAGLTARDAPRVRPLQQLRASAGVIRSSRLALLGLGAMAGSQAAMVAVMTMTPPHMEDHGHGNLSAYVIALHIAGMYGLSPVVGRVVDRIGATRAVPVGAVVLGAGTVATVAAGYVPALMFAGLFLLGLGWNLGLIAGTTLLAASVPAEARVEVQGTGDLTMSACGAIAAFGSGFVKSAAGFHVLADAAAVIAGLLVVATWYVTTTERRVVSRAASSTAR